eukprot:1281957-Rhodomonas_salina.1
MQYGGISGARHSTSQHARVTWTPASTSSTRKLTSPPRIGLCPRDFRPFSRDFRPFSRDFRPFSRDFRPFTHDFEPCTRDFRPCTRDLCVL